MSHIFCCILAQHQNTIIEVVLDKAINFELNYSRSWKRDIGELDKGTKFKAILTFEQPIKITQTYHTRRRIYRTTKKI